MLNVYINYKDYQRLFDKKLILVQINFRIMY